MSFSIDISQIFRTYDSMKQEILESSTSINSLSLKETREQLLLREMQLKTVIDISEKIIKHIQDESRRNNTSNKNEDEIHQSELLVKYTSLENLYSNSEETLKKARGEIKALKSEIKQLEKSQGNNNLFTVEVYQSEIDDLKKDYQEKMSKLQSEIDELKSKTMPQQFLEVKRKYQKCKEQLINTKKKFKEFEDLIIVNNEQKKVTEEKYSLLVKSHMELYSYIEKLESKMKNFQDRHRKSKSNILEGSSKDLHLSSSPPSYSKIKTSQGFSTVGPTLIFSI
ncbi:hypothetical protein SteCoe_3015 [Stentor coeruleus]|uniref:Uncharacterized protein n=1 Tax=Stentor coeruleus TaxID=5963 RepID=A0A1R2CY87_9CILI|nr:hypothetical protein SteCoe_3015 [Stentor coeruleus]